MSSKFVRTLMVHSDLLCFVCMVEMGLRTSCVMVKPLLLGSVFYIPTTRHTLGINKRVDLLICVWMSQLVLHLALDILLEFTRLSRTYMRGFRCQQ